MRLQQDEVMQRVKKKKAKQDDDDDDDDAFLSVAACKLSGVPKCRCRIWEVDL